MSLISTVLVTEVESRAALTILDLPIRSFGKILQMLPDVSARLPPWPQRCGVN